MTFLTQWTAKSLFCQIALFTGILLPGINSATANIVIHSTRIIYPEDSREVTIRMQNKGETPSLVQTWIDKGDTSVPVSTLDVPFVLMPPVSRIDAHRGQTLRLTYTGSTLPKDKESLFWLNVLDIPPKAKKTAENENLLQMAIRSRLKIFFRPVGLNAESALKAAKNLRWGLARTQSGKELIAFNDSPYFVNVSSIIVENAGEKTTSHNGEMIAPGEKQTFSVKSATKINKNGKINYTIINDHGGTTEFEGFVIE
ncbi:fimbria/pilus periplasmic chaperone [Erwinia typographi]|uniref:fimbria/pilus periplasmic chaperone n=1 Tax=Erwinia typographi TaxID=371042 RepID=UPI000907958E|nr:fimbria/pilus periplasmic chaperone [Erwinia typographi]